ncbi:MAG: hypothetical protein KDA52_00800, partial [Planctomycetaceae bacterium]|nr:hypothetical protein [Planctomycetaceae bacterium]
YFFSKLELNGTAHEKWVDLTASLTVHVVATDRWVLVPVRFDQASLLDFNHSGPGEISVPMENQQSRGLTWLLTGSGDHHLQMILRVPLRKTPSGDLLQLELPEMTLFTGRLSLQLPSSSVTIRAEDSVRLLGTRVEDDHTILTAELPGDRLDLGWNIHEQQTEPLMQKPTDVRLRLLDGKIELTARQQIQFGANTSDTLRVRLPSEQMELNPEGVQIIDANGNEQWVQPTATEQPEWVVLTLGDSVSKQVQIYWKLSTTMPPDGREFVIDGFEVADARRQSGTIAIESSDGYLASQVGEDDIGVERIDVSDLPASSTLSTLQAYSFAGPQYRLRLRIEPMVPVVSVTPYYFVKVSQDHIELEAIYQLSVDGGGVRSLPVVWSGEDRGSWDVVASTLTGGLPRKIPRESADASDEWEISLPNVVENRIEAGLSAIRYFETYPPADTVTLSLPTLSHARGLSGWIIVSTDDDVEVSTRADDATVLTPQSESALDSFKILPPDWTRTQPLALYRFSSNRDEATPELEMDLTVQSQTVTTSTVIEVRDLDDQPRISQRLSYDVQFGRLSQVRLTIPPILIERLDREFPDASLRFLLNDEVPLETVWSGDEVIVTLPTPLLGRFDIVIDDYSPSNKQDETPATLVIPIITCVNQDFTSTRLIVPDQTTLSVDVNDKDWKRLKTIADGMQWITSQPVTQVVVSSDPSIERSPQQLWIEKAYLQTVIDDAGHHVTRAKYYIRDSVNEVVIQLPADAVNARYEWNGISLDSNHVVSPSNDRPIRLEKPTSLSMRLSPEVISLSFQSLGDPEPWPDGLSISFPVFAKNVWIDHVWWELKLPPTQHLLISPASMTAQFEWKREGIFWKRMPGAESDQIRVSVRGIEDASEVPIETAGNSYMFVTAGPLTKVEFHKMSKSGIVFVGAGLTLLASFLLIKVPAARHPMIWLTVCLALMTLSLWYLEPMLLLLQPAVFGLALPLCAGLLDYVINGERQPKRRSLNGSTYRETGDSYDSGFSGAIESPVTSTFVRPTVASDSGIDS